MGPPPGRPAQKTEIIVTAQERHFRTSVWQRQEPDPPRGRSYRRACIQFPARRTSRGSAPMGLFRRRKFERTRRRRKYFLEHAIELVEPRVLLAVSAQLLPNGASFLGDKANDSLYLRVNSANQLEYSTDGTNY